ncbi:hypothetical protein V494_05669 [Pseudogymnoascus sp. VKM F-4513 (FW-928)]|nr:hypothetical protein V494_05669 [Pseudogymnoascus sp. VKM F-4513 (FW-928)]
MAGKSKEVYAAERAAKLKAVEAAKPDHERLLNKEWNDHSFGLAATGHRTHQVPGYRYILPTRDTGVLVKGRGRRVLFFARQTLDDRSSQAVPRSL